MRGSGPICLLFSSSGFAAMPFERVKTLRSSLSPCSRHYITFPMICNTIAWFKMTKDDHSCQIHPLKLIARCNYSPLQLHPTVTSLPGTPQREGAKLQGLCTSCSPVETLGICPYSELHHSHHLNDGIWPRPTLARTGMLSFQTLTLNTSHLKRSSIQDRLSV